jgi:hypothetical protein
MDLIEQINKVGLATAYGKPTLKLKDMVIGTTYHIEDIKKVKTAHGSAIMVETAENVIFLPKRFAEELDDKKIKDLKKIKVNLIYRGQKDSGHLNPTHIVEFIKA